MLACIALPSFLFLLPLRFRFNDLLHLFVCLMNRDLAAIQLLNNILSLFLMTVDVVDLVELTTGNAEFLSRLIPNMKFFTFGFVKFDNTETT